VPRRRDSAHPQISTLTEHAVDRGNPPDTNSPWNTVTPHAAYGPPLEKQSGTRFAWGVLQFRARLWEQPSVPHPVD
jgi:hypothetical protein